ncbi:MAG: serine/threonine-protein kinase [Phycisphaerae bacterium]
MAKDLNGFQILRRLGQSNTAEIFHVVRLVGQGRGNEYAVKVLRDEYARDRIERKHLETEHGICSSLRHPNLIRTYALHTDTRRPFLVMDVVRESRSLRQHLERGRPPLGPALEWLAKVADGLGHLHEAGYVHRDIKPQNIVIGNGGSDVKVIDFALARPQDDSFGRLLLRRLSERRRPGTWSYMAPEQIRNKRLTGAADIYSLGVTLYESVTGRLPFSAETAQGLMEQHLYGLIPTANQKGVDVPGEVDDLIRAMLAKDPLDRPTGMQYVSAKLHTAAAACRTRG